MWTRTVHERGLGAGWEHRVVDTRLERGVVFARHRDRLAPHAARRWVRITRDLRHTLRDFRPDVVHIGVNARGPGIVRDLVCSELLRRHQTPFVVHYHGLLSSLAARPRLGFQRTALRALATRAACNVTLNKESRSFLEAEIGGRSPVVQVPNFFDERKIRGRGPRRRTQARALAVYVGAVNRSKGTHVLIETARRLPQVDFLMLGKHYPDCMDVLRHAPSNLEAPGEVLQEEVMDALSRAHLFVFPTAHTEGFPLGVCEAMASGVAVLSCPRGAISEMLEDGAGCIVPDRNPETWTHAIRSLVDDEESRLRIATRGYEKAQQTWMYEHVLERLKEVWTEAAT